MGGQGTHLLNVLSMSFLYTPPSFYTFIGFMDFTQLNYILERMAVHYKVDAQEVLDKWLEKREVCDPEGWRLLKDIPCIVKGLTVLLGKCHSQIIV